MFTISLVVCFNLLFSTLYGESDYKSQAGQDTYFNEIFFQNKRNGVFVDIGAHDGISLSNSWFFEKKLDWTGICIEPQADRFAELIKNRSCICIHGCVAEKEGTVQFRKIDGAANMLSGIESKYDERHKQRIVNELRSTSGSYTLIEVPSFRLNTLLEKHKMYHIDFLSLDIEGGELELVKTIDFDRYYIRTMSVENNYNKPELRQFLESKGFCYITTIDNLDEVYLNTNTPREIKVLISGWWQYTRKHS